MRDIQPSCLTYNLFIYPSFQVEFKDKIHVCVHMHMEARGQLQMPFHES